MPSPSTTVDVRACIAATLLGELPPPALDALCARAAVCRYEVPTLLWGAGEPMSSLWLVVEGQVDLFDRQAVGHESVVGVMGPGRWVSWVGLFMTSPQRQDFSCAAATTLIRVPAAAVRDALARHPELYPRVIDEIGTRLQMTLQWIGQSALLDPAQRLAALLEGLARIQARGDGPVRLATSQTRLAQTLGTSRQLVGRSLEVLEREGLVQRAYGRIEIGDLGALGAFARRAVS
jgi:CRP-like cAMP-binding protein